MADIKFTGSADFSNVEKAYAKLESDTKRLEDQAIKLARAAESGGTAQQRAAERAVDAAGKARASVDQLGESLGKTGGAGAKSGDEIRKSYNEATRDVAKLETANHRLAKSVDSTRKKQVSAAESAKAFAQEGLSQIKSLALGWASLQGVITGVSEAIERVNTNQQKALDAHLQMAPAEELVVKNLVGISPQQKQQVLKQLDDLADELGVKAEPLKRAFSEAISKAGGDIPLALESTKAAAMIHRLSPDQMSTTTAAAASLSRVLGTRDPREALGFANSFQAAAAEANQQMVMGVLPGAVGAVASSVPKADKRRTAEEAAAVLAALNQANPSPGLQSAATAEVGLASQLRQFFQPAPLSDEEKTEKAGQKAKILSRVNLLQKNKKGDRPEIVQAQVERARAQIAVIDREIAGMGVAEDPGTFAGRIAAVQQSEDLQNRLIPTLHGEAAFVDAMKDLVRGKKDARVTQEYEANLKRIRVGSSGFIQQAQELSPTKGLTSSIRLAGKTEQDLGQHEKEMVSRDKAAEIKRIKNEALKTLDESPINLRESLDVWATAVMDPLTIPFTDSGASRAIARLAGQSQAVKNRYLRLGQTIPEPEAKRIREMEEQAADLAAQLARVNRGEKPQLPAEVPEEPRPDKITAAATAPSSTAAAAVEKSNAFRELPTVDDMSAGRTAAPKVNKAAAKSSHEQTGRLKTQLKKVERELSGGSAQLKKQPGRREALQREREQLRQQIADEERSASKVDATAKPNTDADEPQPAKVHGTATPDAEKETPTQRAQRQSKADYDAEQQPLPAPTSAVRETQLPDQPPANAANVVAEIAKEQLAAIYSQATAVQSLARSQWLLAQRLASTAARGDLQAAVQ